MACVLWYVSSIDAVMLELKLLAARSSIHAFLASAIKKGFLCIEEHDGTYEYGTNEKGGNTVHVKVLQDNFWIRLLL